jgi:hypothetical protein
MKVNTVEIKEYRATLTESDRVRLIRALHFAAQKDSDISPDEALELVALATMLELAVSK